MVRAKEAGHQKVEQAPQLKHVVLDRRAREDEAVLGVDLLDRARRLGLGAAYDMALVQDAVVPVQRRKRRNVVAHDIVGHDHRIVRRDLRLQTRALGRLARIENRA